jgi:transposase
MTIPRIGAITSVAFTTSVDDPTRFRKSRSVGAYFGLTNRRDQSGERDIAGRISARDDKLVRGYLGSNLTSDANKIVVCPQIMGAADSQA